jgi:UDP-N-acetylmuramoylalanine--D-glutamate ligase
MHLEGQNIAIIGGGESGVGAAILANKMGANVFVSDAGLLKENYKSELLQLNVEYEESGHDLDRILQAHLVIKSPGIPNTAAVIQSCKVHRVDVVSEIEFAAKFTKAKKICITGSNGKTTTTMLVYHIFKNAGIEVSFAGNVGKSLARQVASKEPEYFIIELSSFQLDDIKDFRADISILLNVTPDHLDRYENNLSLYADSKMRITKNQSASDWFIYNADDQIIDEKMSQMELPMRQAGFSLKNPQSIGGYSNSDQLIINIKEQLSMSIHDLALKGKHNTQNSLAAGIAARIVEIRKDIVRQSLEDFVNVEHRLEFVAKVNGVEFINDSKATNINSTWFALESMEKPTIWIVGGVDKGNDYSELLPLVDEKVKAVICLGENNDKIKDAFCDKVETLVEARSAVEAVAYAYRLARKDESVLLSPACASFDLFESYEDRGNQFKQAVRML